MKEQPQDFSENPLEDLAAELSEALESDYAELTESSKDQVVGGQVWMKQSTARSVEATALHLEESAAGIVQAETIDANGSVMGIAKTNHAELEDSTCIVLMAKEVEATEVRSIALLSGRVEGNVKTVLTPLGAFAAGAGFALTLLMTKRILGKIWPFSKWKTK